VDRLWAQTLVAVMDQPAITAAECFGALNIVRADRGPRELAAFAVTWRKWLRLHRSDQGAE
jgi:hypothetical protein